MTQAAALFQGAMLTKYYDQATTPRSQDDELGRIGPCGDKRPGSVLRLFSFVNNEIAAAIRG
jgi:hypothetical protein